MKSTSPLVDYRYYRVCLFLIVLIACNKQYAPKADPVQQNIIHLTGNSRAYAEWKFTDIQFDQSSQPLNPAFAGYRIAYHLNGSFTDSDGLQGLWLMVSKDSLKHKITNNPNGVNATHGYRITYLTATEMGLSYLANGQKVTAAYTIVK